MMALDDDGNPFTSKGVGETIVGEGFEEFYNKYMLDFAHRECAIHFRMRTSGAVDIENAHPYEVGDHVFVMHNGMISVTEHDKTKSDTWHFAQLIEEQVAHGWLRNARFKTLCEMAIGQGNKLVFLDKEGFVFYNKHQGTEHYGSWFSNSYAWDAPGKYTSYGYWGDLIGEEGSYTGTGRFPSQGTIQKYRESYSTSPNGSTQRAIFLADGTKIVLDPNSETTKSNLEEAKEQTIEKIQETCKSEEFSKLSADEQAKYFIESEGQLRQLDRIAGHLQLTNAQQTASTALALREDEEEEIVVNTVSMPETFSEWAGLSLEELYKLNYQEPDMIAEAFFDALHLVEIKE